MLPTDRNLSPGADEFCQHQIALLGYWPQCRKERFALHPIRLTLLLWMLLCVSSILGIGCKQAESYPPAGWHKLDARTFSIYAPAGWSFRDVMSVDSYMGQFVGDGVTLEFDVGWFTEDLDDSRRGPNYFLRDESIGGLPAKLGYPRALGQGITAVYFPHVHGSNRLYISGRDLTAVQQELALKIFHTIRFRDSNPTNDDPSHRVR